MILAFKSLLNLPNEEIEKLLRVFIFKFLIITFITTIAASFYNYLKHHKWNIGDWLINYQGGMVRRGFSGELFYKISLFTDISVGFITFLFQVVFYAVFFVLSYKLLKRQRSLVPYILLIFSPFIYAYQVVHAQGGYRKEIIFFAILAYVVYAAKIYNLKSFKKSFYIALILFPALILSHEMFAVYLPYLLIAFIYKKETLNEPILFKEVSMVILLLIPSVIAFLFSVYYSGSPLQVSQIYSSLTDIGYPISGGAIEWLGKSTAYGLDQVSERMKNEHYVLFYFHTIVLSIIAYIPIRNHLRAIFNNKISFSLMFISILGSIALCVVAIDWGRFIYINLVAIFLLSLLYKSPILIERESPHKEVRSIKHYCKSKFNIYVIVISLIFYSQLWRIPHCCDPVPYSQVNAVLYFKPYIKILGKAIKWL